MDRALDDIIAEYEAAWGRKPHVEELQAVFDFVNNPRWHQDEGIEPLADSVIASLEGSGR